MRNEHRLISSETPGVGIPSDPAQFPSRNAATKRIEGKTGKDEVEEDYKQLRGEPVSSLGFRRRDH